MGLDCSHGAFSGAYSAFNRFRQSVAEACGGSYPPHSQKFAARVPRCSPLDWYWTESEVPPEHRGAARLFFDHSDCDGSIAPNDAARVAAFLRWAAPRMAGVCDGHLSDFKRIGDVAIRFADGCEEAFAAGEPLVFG